MKNLKEQANQELINSKNEKAIEKYLSAISIFESAYLTENDQNDKIEAKRVYVILLANLSQAYLNVSDCQNAILMAKKTISIDNENVKAYFRAGKAYK